MTDSNKIAQAHCHRGGIGAFVKNLGVGPPRGKFFPKIFFRDIDLQIFLSNAGDRGNIWLILCNDRTHTGCAVGPDIWTVLRDTDSVAL